MTELLIQKKQTLESIRSQNIQGSILRSKSVHVEFNEKNTKYFASLEKKHAEKKTIYKLKVDNNIVTGIKNTLNEEVKFYKKLYSKDNNIDVNVKELFLNTPTNTLSDNEKASCEGLLTPYECENALKEMKNEKSPGSDGLTTEFYKLFWNEIQDPLINSLNASFQSGSLTQLQKQGIITLIPKPDKDLDQLSNWRPISLLNLDYKIATKAIANRIKKVLSKIIDHDQTGFIKGRYIGENVRLIAEIIQYLENNNKPGLLFFADFQKAFDSIDHSFIFDSLNKFNFGPDIIQWTKTFYNDIQSIIINNGHLSETFKIEKGVRQGCPLSSILFIICLQILSSYIKNNDNISGIKVDNIEIKQSLFADDATYFNEGSKQSFGALIETLEMFSKCSGLNLNINKSVILRVGSLKKSTIKFCERKPFIWTSECATALGKTFYNNNQETIDKNIKKKLSEFQNVLKQWEHRKLTLMGKVTVVKTYALPKLIYPFSVLANPKKNIIESIKTAIFKFIWDGKPDKIKRNILYQTYENGGLNLTNIEQFLSSIKASWVKRYLDENNKRLWKHFFYINLKPYGNKLIFECDIDKSIIDKLSKSGTFLNDVLVSWVNIKQIHDENTNVKVGKTVIWNNKKLKSAGNTFFSKTGMTTELSFSNIYLIIDKMNFMHSTNLNSYII